MHANPRNAFTLIELMVVVGIIAILATVVVLTINPVQLLTQGRDSNRLADMSSLSVALADYQSIEHGSMGVANTIYVSLPDSSPTCNSWNLPTPPSGFVYQCAPSSTYRRIDGTGWIPVNFNSLAPLSPISILPIDPINTSSTGLYYTYSVSSTQYEVTSLFESQKYKAQYAQNPIDPYYPDVDIQGSPLAVSPLFNASGLVGYWPLDEGTGTVAMDSSGNGNNGTWSGTPAGTNGYYSSGKVEPWAGTFYSTNSNAITIAATSSLENFNNITICAWVNLKILTGSYEGIIGKRVGNTFEYGINFNNTTFQVYTSGPSGISGFSYTLPLNTWTFVCGVMSSAPTALYINGSLFGTNGSGGGIITSTNNLFIGSSLLGTEFFNGLIGEVRIYNRALSAAEISAIYNAEK